MLSDEDRIARTFKCQKVLITGGTGFMGHALIERLLRVTEFEEMYLLLRPKRGKSPKERVKDLLSNMLFDTLRQQSNYDEVVAKITVVEGDCSIDDLGIHVDDWNELCKHVTIIYHFAATTRFDAELKPATELNLCGTREMIKLARECKQLTLFCYISTAYCHLSEQYLEEKAYDPPYDPYMFMEEVSKMTVSEAEVFMKDFPREVYPNTYVLTKALSETLVLDALENHKLPVMILRPSVVTSTIETPVKGWCPNYNGLGGLLIAIGKGVIRTAHCNKKYYFDFLPVDIATGGLMIATWNYLALNERDTFILNFTTSNIMNMKWEDVAKKGFAVARDKYPMSQMLWYPNIALTHRMWLHKLRAIFYHWIPAIIIDSLLFCIRVKPFLWNVHMRIANATAAIGLFANKQWDFDNTNMVKIRSKMNAFEVKNYRVFPEGLDLDQLVEDFILGGHKFLLKSGCEEKDFARGRRLMKIMYVLDRGLKLLFWAFVLYYLLTTFAKYF